MTLERGLWRWKGSAEKSTRAEWERMKYWSIDPCLDPSCMSFCPCNYDIKCYFPINLSLVSFCRQHAVFVLCLSPAESFSLSGPLLSPSHIYHLRLSRWEENKSRGMRVRGRRLHSSSWRLAPRLQIYIFPEYENGKMPSKFPACWSVNRVIRAPQYRGELSVFLGRRAQKTAALASSLEMILPLNLYLNTTGRATVSGNTRRN